MVSDVDLPLAHVKAMSLLHCDLPCSLKLPSLNPPVFTANPDRYIRSRACRYLRTVPPAHFPPIVRSYHRFRHASSACFRERRFLWVMAGRLSRELSARFPQAGLSEPATAPASDAAVSRTLESCCDW